MEKRFDTFSMLVSGINKSMKKIKTTEMAKFGLKSTHVFCIYHLYKENALTAGELCGMCREDKAGISRAIEQLEKKGCVTSAENGGKKYRTPFMLTEKGRQIAKQIAEKADELIEIAGRGLQESEIRIFYSCLEKINENLQDICDGYEKAHTAGKKE